MTTKDTMKIWFYITATEIGTNGTAVAYFSTAVQATSWEHARNKFAKINPFAKIDTIAKD